MRLVASLMESLPAAMAAGRFGRVILQAQMSLHDMNLSHAGRFWQSDAASMGVAEQGKAECCRNTWQVQLGKQKLRCTAFYDLMYILVSRKHAPPTQANVLLAA